jgi:hypothetical protein
LNYEFAFQPSKEEANPMAEGARPINLDDFGIKVAYDGMPFLGSARLDAGAFLA